MACRGGRAPAFQVTDRSCPGGLDAALEKRGYLVDAPVSIQVATTAAVLAAASSRDAVVTRACTDAWFNLSAHHGRFANVADTYRGLLMRIGPAARFALASLDGQPAAVSLGVVGQGWMGIFSMLTLPSARRRGAVSCPVSAFIDGLEDGGRSLRGRSRWNSKEDHAARRGQTTAECELAEVLVEGEDDALLGLRLLEDARVRASGLGPSLREEVDDELHRQALPPDDGFADVPARPLLPSGGPALRSA